MKRDIRGGILADEMGMGKTIQTIATILDNRPKLQHCKPYMKHPLSDDLKERQKEDALWEQGRKHLHYEWDILKVMKKILSRDGGGRGGQCCTKDVCCNIFVMNDSQPISRLLTTQSYACRNACRLSSDCIDSVEDRN